MSTATKSTSAFCRLSKNAASRDNRSSFAISSVAFSARARAKASSSPHSPALPEPSPGAPAPSPWAREFYIAFLRLRMDGAVLTMWGMGRIFQDDLVAVNASRLRALGVIRPGAKSALVTFALGEDWFEREIGLWHREWSHGRGLSLFLCPKCKGKAAVLKVHDGAPQCRNCLKRGGVQFRISYGTRAGRAEARARRIEVLKAKLMGGPLRVDGGGLMRRRELEQAFRRAKIREREALLEEARR